VETVPWPEDEKKIEEGGLVVPPDRPGLRSQMLIESAKENRKVLKRAPKQRRRGQSPRFGWLARKEKEGYGGGGGVRGTPTFMGERATGGPAKDGRWPKVEAQQRQEWKVLGGGVWWFLFCFSRKRGSSREVKRRGSGTG